MSRFRKSEPRKVPILNTASLPDLIFTTLFFFMIVTHMTSVPPMTQFELPNVTELQKLEEKSLVVYIMVGKNHENKSTVPVIQLNSEFVSLEEMPTVLERLKKKALPEEQDKMMAVVKVDRNTPMGLVNDIKKILRESSIVTVHYGANKKY